MPFRRSTIISITCCAAIFGIILGRHGWIVGNAIYLLIPFAFGSLFVRKWFALVLIISALLLGIMRGHTALEQSIALEHLIGQTVTLTAVIADDPATSPKNVQSFSLNDLRLNGHAIAGQLPVYTYPLRVHRGFQVAVTGKIKPGFGKYTAELVYPKLTIISSEQSWLEQLRAHFFAGMRTALPEPDASFALGLLVGIRALIPKDLQSTLALVGLSHLVAVSGYNLTIIVRAIERLLARFGRGVTLITTFWIIGGFLAVTGASSSVVRAAVVSVLMLLGSFYGRRFQPLVILLLAAAATALVKPDYLTDLGWLLSFLAFYGILILTPAIWQRFGEPKSVVGKLFVESLSAQIMTLPLILFIFGQLSIVAPLTNVIILPLVPVAMAVCFIAGLAGMLIPAWCGWLAWPAGLLLKLILNIIAGFAGLPWAGSNVYIDAPTMVMAYIVIALMTIILRRGQAKSPAIPGSTLVHS